MSLFVHGLGTSVPVHTMDQSQAFDLAAGVLAPDETQLRLLNAIYRRAGVQKRHTCVPYETGFEWAKLPLATVSDPHTTRRGASTRTRMRLYEEHAAPQAVSAAHVAFKAANCIPSDITHLVTISCTGFHAPGVDASLIQQLQLSSQVERVHIGFMGCHGSINGLRVASALAALSERHKVLMCAVELCSLHYFFEWVPDKLVSNALFADGAAALICGSTQSTSASWRVVATGSCMLPDSSDAMSWRLGDYGFEMSLCSTVPKRIEESLRSWLASWLDRHGVGLEDIAHWAIHPGGPRIVTAVEGALELPRQATRVSREILSEFGNMSSPTVLFIAQRLLAQGAQGRCVMIAFGPGLVAEAALIEFSDDAR